MPDDYTYTELKEAILNEFSNLDSLDKRKNRFMSISISENESIMEFADQFYLEGHCLIGARVLNNANARISLAYALKNQTDILDHMVVP